MNQTILITGATSGFGRACAELFAARGWRLILCGRRRERLEEMRNAFPETAMHCAPLDVRSRSQVDAFTNSIPEEFQGIDVLVNNAGVARGLEPAHEANLDDWEQMIDTNIKGLCYMTRAILPDMVRRKRGHIINMGSVAGSWPYPGGNTYGATKAFVRQFSNNLRTDLPGSNVRVTNIEPGMAETEFSIVRFHGDKEKAGSVYRGTAPLGAKDIAEIVYWVTTAPAHVNINAVEVMPLCQSWAPFAIHRSPETNQE